MKLKGLFLGCTLCCLIPAFSQEGYKLNVYSDMANFLGFKPSIGHVKINSSSIESSFFFGAYSIKMENVNDSLYQETITRKFPLKKAKEKFSYVNRDGRYYLVDYEVFNGSRRNEKDSLLNSGVFFDKDVSTPIKTVNNLTRGLEGEIISFFIMGCNYSLKLEKKFFQEYVQYSTDLKKVTKPGEDDGLLFDSFVRANVSKRGIESFLTSFKSGNESSKKNIEGKRLD